MLLKKRKCLELMLGMLLLICFYVLSKEVAVSAGNDKGKSVIVIDPGHGGEDPGTIGINDIQEKKINLQISILLKEELEKLGYDAVLTRADEGGLYQENTKNKKAEDLQERIKIIRRENPVLAISIHQNSYQDSSVKGPQVFYYQNSEKGKALAESIQKEMNTLPGVERPRAPKENATYYLLKRSSTVMNIVECGFLTNEIEAELLQESEYQKKIAEAIVRGIQNYLKQQSG